MAALSGASLSANADPCKGSAPLSPLTTDTQTSAMVAVDMSRKWNPLSALDKMKLSPQLSRQKSFSDSEIVAADMTNYNDPVRESCLASPTVHRANSKGNVLKVKCSTKYKSASAFDISDHR